MSDKKNLTNEFFLYIFFPPTWLKNLCRDSWTKEYSECRLMATSQYFLFKMLYLKGPHNLGMQISKKKWYG